MEYSITPGSLSRDKYIQLDFLIPKGLPSNPDYSFGAIAI